MPGSFEVRATYLTFERFATALFFVALMLAACLMPAQTDTWWQLRTGEEMWRSHHVILHDEFTHTVPGGYWPNHEWLAQLVFYAAYRVGGLPMLTALCAGAVTIAWGVAASLVPGPRLRRVALLGAGAILTSPSWSLRPQVFSLALLAITIWIIARRRWVWILPPLFVLWANLHGAVALGGVLLVSAVLTALLVEREQFMTVAAVAVACLFCTAATPLGFSLWREVPSSLARLHAYGVLEWQAPGVALGDLPFWIVVITLVVLLALSRGRLRTSRTTVFLATASMMFLALALRSRRNIPPFILCSAPLIGTLLNDRIPSKPRSRAEHPVLNAVALATALLLGIVGVGTAWAQPIPRLGWSPVTEELRRAVTGCPGQLYNKYDDGGYLIWFARDKKVFMDSRQDPFPQDIVRAHIQLEQSGDYAPVFTRFDIGCALTVEDSPLGAHLLRDGWRRRSGDGSWVLFSRPEAAASPAATGTSAARE